MGPPDLHAIILQQKDKIMRLSLQLEASRSRNSHLNARVFSTLDTLDYLQLELDLERKRNHTYLSAQAAWKEKMRELEAERDDMKRAVEMLIKEVERSNGDYRNWPRSRMYLPNPVAPCLSTTHDFAEHKVTPTTEALVQSLASEHYAHIQTLQALEQAKEQNDILNAKVARREAELESLNFRVDDVHVPALHTTQHKDPPTADAWLSGVSQEQALGILQITADRNRALETEIKVLAERLDLARKSEQADKECAPNGEPRPQSLESVAVQTSPPDLGPSTTTRGLLEFGEQINAFAQAVDKFKEERHLTAEALKATKEQQGDPVTGSSPTTNALASVDVPFPRILMIEDECIRLQRLNDSLHADIIRLQEENNNLQLTLSQKPHSSTHLASPRSQTERDMELSTTPLHDVSDIPEDHSDETDSLAGFNFLAFGPSQHQGPTNSSVDVQPSSASSHAPVGSTPTHDKESSAHWPWDPSSPSTEAQNNESPTRSRLSPSQIALPDSPEEQPSPTSKAQARIVEIERELEVARAMLEVKDAELKRVTKVMEKLKVG